jgi:hypothetical protein
LVAIGWTLGFLGTNRCFIAMSGYGCNPIYFLLAFH